MDKTCLNKHEEEKLKNALLDFVLRASSTKATDSERAILPLMTQLILEFFTEHYLP